MSQNTPARRRLRRALRPHISRTQLLVGLLCLVLGFGLATQVHANREESEFAAARQDELVGILDTLSQRSDRLRAEIQSLEQTRAELEQDTRGEAAVAEARRRASTYAVLAGTVPVTGPGIELVVNDPGGKVTASMLLDTLQELRDAGAEAVQIGGVRAIASTYFRDASGRGIVVDGQRLFPPYRLLVIGDPHTLSTALDIPGGIMESLRSAGAEGVVTQREEIRITAVRAAASPQYARATRDGDRKNN
ncbi:MAG: DUF881 domain-containing protein [Streptosporangiales bacterium]|nr:DUF881 domain-containing protein [Streptosporangiales bacterium]